jgi:chromosome segregation ATPase
VKHTIPFITAILVLMLGANTALFAQESTPRPTETPRPEATVKPTESPETPEVRAVDLAKKAAEQAKEREEKLKKQAERLKEQQEKLKEQQEKVAQRKAEAETRLEKLAKVKKELEGKQASDAVKTKTGEACTVVKERLTKHATGLETRNAAQSAQLSKAQTRVLNLIQRFKTAGLDTTILEAEMNTFAAKIAAVTAAQQALVAATQTASIQSCGTGSGEFKSGLGDARSEAKALQDARQAARDQLKVVKTEISALKALLPEPSPSPEASPSVAASPVATVAPAQ